MKKYIFLIVVMFIIATIFIIADNTKANTDINNIDEIRSIYFSYIELQEYLKDKDEETMKDNIDEIIENMNNNNFNWLILQVRPFSDSIYPSSIFPNSSCVTSDDFSFDILEYFIKIAHSYNIKVHAWINPYRVSNDTNFSITENHPAYQFLNTNNIKIIEDKGIYYNPASSLVTDLIISGIEEIINNYDIDGIHFDDYFYPSSDIDIDNYNEYIENGGSMTIHEYHLDIIKKMLREVYLKIKELDSSVLFGIAPEGNIDNNYSSNYLDVKDILSSSSYLDYVMPQIYYGFDNSVKPFIETVSEWQSLIKGNIMFIPALSLYKSGNIDNYAKDGSNEWIENTDIIKRQIIYLRTISSDGFSIFRYDYLYNSSIQNDNTKIEVDNIFNILK